MYYFDIRYLQRFIDEPKGNKHWETVLQFKPLPDSEWEDVPIVEEEISS